MESIDRHPLDQFLAQVAQAIQTRPQVYTISETADLLKCGERTIRTHLYEKRDLKYLLLGREVRILESDLREFLERRRKPCVNDKDILP